MRLPHQRGHIVAWCVLAIVLPALLLWAFSLRGGPAPDAPQRLAPPGRVS